MFIATVHPQPIKLRRSGMSPRWGLKPDCMVAGYKHAAPLALDPPERLQAGTATELDSLLPEILDRAFIGQF